MNGSCAAPAAIAASMAATDTTWPVPSDVPHKAMRPASTAGSVRA